jgi:hypothetical protein
MLEIKVLARPLELKQTIRSKDITYKTPNDKMATTVYLCLRDTLSSKQGVSEDWYLDKMVGWVLTSEKDPRKRQNDHVCGHVERSIGVVESRLVEASALNCLVPVEVEGPALKEECDSESGLFCKYEGGKAVEEWLPVVNFREAPDEEKDDRQLYGAQSWRIENLGAKATLQVIVSARLSSILDS